MTQSKYGSVDEAELQPATPAVSARSLSELPFKDVQYKNFIEHLPVLFYAVEVSFPYTPLYVSPAFSRFGYPIEDWLNDPEIWVRVIHPEDRPRVFNETKLSTQSGEAVDYEYRIVGSNGMVHWVRDRGCLITDDAGQLICREGVILETTPQKYAEEQLKQGEERFRNIFENASDAIYVHDLSGRFLSLNKAAERVFGLSSQEAVKTNFLQLVTAEHHSAMQARLEHSFRNKGGESAYEIECNTKDGRRITLEVNSSTISKGGEVVAIQGIARDITERKRIEDAIRESGEKYRQLGEGLLHQIWTADSEGSLDYVNRRTLEFFNKTNEEMLGEGWMAVVHPDDLPSCLTAFEHSFKTGEALEAEFRLRRHDGQYRWHVARATAGLDADGNVTKWFGTNTDIHEQKESEEKLNYYAKHDPLTDLPNRVEFMNHLNQAIARAEENPEGRFAVLFLDLDRFKVINDSLGHVVGDQLLINVASRLKNALRPGDVVARLGGDEFTILLNRTGTSDDVLNIVERIQTKIAAPLTIGNYEVFTTASVGVIISDDVKRTADNYLRDADAAMYRAKEGGKARYEIFDRAMHVRNLNLLQLETDLRHAVERKEFEVLYQPIVDLSDGTVSEFEALIRWSHPMHGMISPNEFVGVAEETGSIIQIGGWILEESLRQTAEWQRGFGDKLSISVNLSAKQLMHPALISQVEDILTETGLDPRQLKLEVTESTVMEHSERSLAVLNELDRMGIHLSTDDFGTGYSSLSYLQRFPFDRLKIDRSFIDRLGVDKKSDAIVKTILMLGQNLGIQVVAEGIESEGQLRHLQKLGCRLGQGYFFSKPVEKDLATKILKKNTPNPAFEGSIQIPIEEVIEFVALQ